MAPLAIVVVFQGLWRRILVVDRVLDDNEDSDCNNREQGDYRFDHQAFSLVCAETDDLAVSVPRQRAVEAATEGNWRNERKDRKYCNN